MGRVTVVGVVISAVLGPVVAAFAGGAHPVPPVRVVPPGSGSGSSVKLERDDLPGPQPEVMKRPGKIDTPAVPDFDLPATEPGFHSPRELRVRGKPLLRTEVKVKGYVTWVYDCLETLASVNPKASREQITAAIRNEPALCERPQFSLGDAQDTSSDASVTVVDPAPIKPERGKPPGDDPKARPAMPRVSLGDYVAVTGTWAIDTGYSNGVLAYAALERTTRSPGGATSDAPAGLKEMEIDVDGSSGPPMRKFVDDQTLNSSVEHLNACNKGIVARQYDAAIAECEAATKIWEDNHLAWYAWAGAHMAKREWSQARAAIEHAVTQRPDQAMYQLYYGIALYEAERERARDAQARRERKKPDDIELDPSALKLDAARDALSNAVRLIPDLWRAHYYLGRIHRDLDDVRRAAVQFTATIKTHPGYRFAYVALIELYRHWDYVDQALAVATLGTANVPAADAAELWFEVGMAYDAKYADDKAIGAFGKAIAGKPDDASSKFQRGQIYLRKGDLASARRDLEDVARSADPRVAAAKQLANQLLGQLAGGKGTSRRLPSWDCRRTVTGTMIVCRPRA